MLKSILIVICSCCAYVVAAPTQGVEKQINLITLGTSRNVTYFAGREEISWNDGKALCEFNNLTMAEVHHQDQELFLKEALTNLDEFSHYHAGGRTRIGLDSLVWDDSKSAITALTGGIQIDEVETRCLLIRVPNYNTLWETDPCTDQWPPICMTK